MKKSTLITTIAMIVVVVVALSTATYAWFNSSRFAAATAANITTNAGADWSLAQGSIEGTANTESKVTTGTVTFGTPVQNIALKNSMAQGLWTPVGAISTTVNSDTGATTGANFVSADLDNEGKAIANAAPIDKEADYIQVTNATADDHTLLLNVVINIGPESNTNTKANFAGAAIRYYVMVVEQDKIYTNGINYTETASIANGTEITKSSNSIVASNDSSTPKVVYNDPIAYANAVSQASSLYTTQSNYEAYNIQQTDRAHVYSLELGEVEAYDTLTLVVYTWIDGWTADFKAAGASGLSVTYAFTTKQTGGGSATE